ESCSKVAWVSNDYNYVRQFLVGENGNKTTCDKAVFASVGYAKTLKKAFENASKHPFINDLQPQCKVDFSTLQFPHRIMMLIAVNNTENEPTSGELDEVFRISISLKTIPIFYGIIYWTNQCRSQYGCVWW
ncbi:MAG: hypothetical protein J6X43_06510, partial [Bacteroidales bacterium]|nr:hypothetical protein [Bacteroidales bacterium]